ncbi:NAD(P)-binding domain superfamily protein [Abortiporus biennis]
MRVLLLGATGFIGLPVAQALVRAGHIVHGLTHNPAKAKQLQADEVIPIVGDYLNPAEWLTPSLVAKLDVVINVVSIELRIKDPESDSRIIKLLVELAQQSRPTYAPKLSFIYTTGVMLYGQDPREVVNDTTAISPDKLPEFVKAVPNFEQQVLKNPVLNSITIRPGLVYGRSGSLTANLFSQAKEGNTIKHFGVEGWRARAWMISWGTLSRSPVRRVMNTLNLLTFGNPLSQRPVKASLVDHLQIYFDAWKASL